MVAAAPTASTTIMFAYRFGKDENYASHHFALSTVLSMLTLPSILLIAELFAKVFAG